MDYNYHFSGVRLGFGCTNFTMVLLSFHLAFSIHYDCRPIKRELFFARPLTMAISIVCRASLGIFGEVLSFGSAKMSANAHEPVVE